MLKFILSILLVFNSTLFAGSGQQCQAIFNGNGAYLGDRWVRFEDGDTVWNRYQCKSCTEIVNARPTANGQQVCKGCGAPHTNETYFKGPRVRKDGITYVLASDMANGESLQLAKSGFKWGCPFCERSNFAKDNYCQGCGAQTEGLTVLNQLMETVEQSRNRVAPSVSTTSSTNRTSVNDIVINPSPLTGNVADQTRKLFGKSLPYDLVNRHVKEVKEFLRKNYRVVGATVVAAVVSGTVYYFQAAQISPGKIVSVQGNEITVQFDQGGKSEEIKLVMDQPTKAAHTGEEVAVHWNRQSGIMAVERADTNDYAAVKKAK